eukprot:scaffold24326_cov79-Skeletonema_dohrnii-CCMP3373.AAC.3
MPQLTSMHAHVLSCVPVASPTSELLDLLPKRVKMLIFPHEQVVVMDGRACDGVSIDSDWQSIGMIKSGPRGELFRSMKILKSIKSISG